MESQMESQVEAPQSILDQLEQVSGNLIQTVEVVDPKDAEFDPGADERSIKQAIAHLRDYYRGYSAQLRQILSAPTPASITLDPFVLTDTISDTEYADEKWPQVLDDFRQVRTETLEYLREATPDQWNKTGLTTDQRAVSVQDLVQALLDRSNQEVEHVRYTSWLVK